ncbi:MAG: cation transporter, partial [Bacteroidetes bacterium]|nr:cation transporter [Bacteroidota bacterium]
MKRFCILAVISLLLAITAYGSSKEELEKVTLKVEGMATACCVPRVEEALLKVKGVKKVSVCIKRGIAEVEMETGQVT